MDGLKNAKKRYDAIPIPKELSLRVQEAISSSENKRKKTACMQRGKRFAKGVAAAAVIVIAFTAVLNLNMAFAEEVCKIPVIGTVARVLTFRSYERTEEDLKISVKIPEVDMISRDTTGLADSVNEEIYTLCTQYAKEAEERAKEYKKAFLETGGTQEEWEAHQIEIQVDYEIKSQTEDYLSFAVMGMESWNAASGEIKYYNMDLRKEKIVTLEDILGENYIAIANEEIQRQMEQRTAEGAVFWTLEEGGFTSISEDVRFYMNEAGNPVIVFEKYEVAPGYVGEVEFEIK